MNDQWAKAKAGNGSSISSNDKQLEMSAIELIAQIKTKYSKEDPEPLYIEHAVARMNKRQFDDAAKLVMQLDEGEGRTFMLKEIEAKRNA